MPRSQLHLFIRTHHFLLAQSVFLTNIPRTLRMSDYSVARSDDSLVIQDARWLQGRMTTLLCTHAFTQ